MANENYIMDFLLQHKENVFFEAGVDIHKILTTASALGNTNGGTIVLGIKSTGETIGISASLSEEINRHIIEEIVPSLPYTLSTMERQGKQVAVLSVWEGADKPYTVDGQIYLQIGDSIQKADSEQTIRILNQNVCIGNGWERTPIHDASKEDISEEVIERFRNQLRKDNRIPNEASTIGIMRKLGFISAGNITNAGIVVTAKEPTAFFPQTRIRVSVFGENQVLQEVRVFETNMVECIDPLVDFVYSLYPQKMEIVGTQRQSFEQLPKVALREGILNAVVHRRYDDYQTTMRVNIYTDRLEIVNSGRLPEGLTIDDLSKQHVSQLRNPDIANAFYVLRYIEAAGSGTLRIIEECKKNLCAMPEWRQGEDSVSLIFRVPLPHEKYNGALVIDHIITGLTTNEATQRDLVVIYKAISNLGNIKIADVQKLIGKSYVTCKRYLQLLKEAGLIEYRGSLKTGGWFAVSQ